MDLLNSGDLQITSFNFYPIAREYAKRLKIAETINMMVDTQMDLPPGEAITAMVIDSFSGRTPLYSFFDSMLDRDNEIIFR